MINGRGDRAGMVSVVPKCSLSNQREAGTHGKVPVARQATQQPLSSNLGTRVTTEQRLSHLENSFARLEHVTGVRETDELEKLLGITDTPLTERVAQLTEQLSKLTEQLKSEYVSRETMETITVELTGESESLWPALIKDTTL